MPILAGIQWTWRFHWINDREFKAYAPTVYSAQPADSVRTAVENTPI